MKTWSQSRGKWLHIYLSFRYYVIKIKTLKCVAGKSFVLKNMMMIMMMMKLFIRFHYGE